MELLRRLKKILKLNVHCATLPIQNLSRSLVLLHAKHYINVMIAKNRLIILNAIETDASKRASLIY